MVKKIKMSKQMLLALEYLQDNIDIESWQNNLKWLYKQFKSEYLDNRTQYLIWERQMVYDWLLWLPSWLHIEFNDYDIKQLYKQWDYKNYENKNSMDYWNLMAYFVYEIWKTDEEIKLV